MLKAARVMMHQMRMLPAGRGMRVERRGGEDEFRRDEKIYKMV